MGELDGIGHVTNLRLNIRNWKEVHWSGESRFLLRPVDVRI